MPHLHRLESPDGDPYAGGLLIVWDDPGAPALQKVVSWRQEAPVLVEKTARRVVEDVIEAIRGTVWLDRTNWVSLTACVCAELVAWNTRCEAALTKSGASSDGVILQ
jgi:hypothetical protein